MQNLQSEKSMINKIDDDRIRSGVGSNRYINLAAPTAYGFVTQFKLCLPMLALAAPQLNSISFKLTDLIRETYLPSSGGFGRRLTIKRL